MLSLVRCYVFKTKSSLSMELVFQNLSLLGLALSFPASRSSFANTLCSAGQLGTGAAWAHSCCDYFINATNKIGHSLFIWTDGLKTGQNQIPSGHCWVCAHAKTLWHQQEDCFGAFHTWPWHADVTAVRVSKGWGP